MRALVRVALRASAPRAVRFTSQLAFTPASSAATRFALATAGATVGTLALWSSFVEAAPSVDYKAVRKAIAELLEDDKYDDGSYAPVFIRLAWHQSGSFDKATGTGGSNGATIRYSPEKDYGANAGLAIARDRLEKVKQAFPEISYADLYTLAGVVAVEEMGGPTIKWRPGRTDAKPEAGTPPDGRLPDAAKGSDHIRQIFYGKGFNDQEIVALLGCHSVGRMHLDRSGFEGPWTHSPTTFSNLYFKDLLSEKWTLEKNPKGAPQFYNGKKDIAMLPADMAVATDPEFRKYAEIYAKDEARFFKDFAAAYSKLLELGVPFADDSGLLSWGRCCC